MAAVFFAGAAFFAVDFFAGAAFFAVVVFAALFFAAVFFAGDALFAGLFFVPEAFCAGLAAGEAVVALLEDEAPNMPAAPCASISRGPSPSRSEFTDVHVFFNCSPRSSGASSRSCPSI